MRSGWFFGTEMFNAYLQEYAKTRPECLQEWKSSPLADDHDFSEAETLGDTTYQFSSHLSQVVDLRTHQWSDVRKSYRGIINKARRSYSIEQCGADGMTTYKALHCAANGGQPRVNETYQYYARWIRDGLGMLVLARSNEQVCAGAYWALYKNCAYYGSGASIVGEVQHAVIWTSLTILQLNGIAMAELGQIDGDTEKERNIGKFKTGFGGGAKPFTVVKRIR